MTDINIESKTSQCGKSDQNTQFMNIEMVEDSTTNLNSYH